MAPLLTYASGNSIMDHARLAMVKEKGWWNRT
jgi:hypothetical protein